MSSLSRISFPNRFHLVSPPIPICFLIMRDNFWNIYCSDSSKGQMFVLSFHIVPFIGCGGYFCALRFGIVWHRHISLKLFHTVVILLLRFTIIVPIAIEGIYQLTDGTSKRTKAPTNACQRVLFRKSLKYFRIYSLINSTGSRPNLILECTCL